MTIALLNKPELSILNKQALRYNLADAEKDYLLAIVSKIIYGSALRDKLVFKGGTAIHHCYLPQTRFSEDLDFTSLDKAITFEEVKTVLESQDFLEVKEEYVSGATIKIERLKYSGPLGLPNSLKVEIDFLQNVVLPAKTLPYRNAWRVDTKVSVMDVREIFAEKIRAAGERARYRDFYDLVLLVKKFRFDFQEIKDLIGRKEIRKSITAASISAHWAIAKNERQREIGSIYYGGEVSDTDIETMIKKIKI